MNVFQVLFWAVWFIYAAFLALQLREAWRRKKGRNYCSDCRKYKGCENLHWIIDQGHPLPCCCEDFEGTHHKSFRRKRKKEKV